MIIVTVAVGSGRSRHVAPKKLHQGGLLEHFLEAVINSIINSVSQLVVTHNYTFLFDLDYMYLYCATKVPHVLPAFFNKIGFFVG